MRFVFMVMAGASVCSGVAQAQTAPVPADNGYVQALAEATFGDVSSQSYGAEIGFTVRPNLQVFVEGGRTNNVAPAAFSAGARLIASFLSQTQSGVSVTAKESAAFGAAGVRYVVPVSGSTLRPYVMGGFGIASVTQKVAFTVGGADVTNSLAQYGVVLGSDLSGTFTKPMLALGGGVAVPVGQHLVADVHYRFQRILAEDQGINVSRAGIGLGIRF